MRNAKWLDNERVLNLSFLASQTAHSADYRTRIEEGDSDELAKVDILHGSYHNPHDVEP